MKNVRRAAAILVGLATILVAVVVVALIQATLAQHHAEIVMQELRTMGAGQTDYGTLRELLRRTGKDADTCAHDQCSAYFAYNNGLMERLHLANGLQFSAYVTVKNGYVDDIQTDEILIVRRPQVDESRRFVLTIRENPRFVAADSAVCMPRLRRDGLGTPAEAVVRLNSSCSAQLRTAAYSFDLRCLSRVGGCTDVRELNPSLWNSETASQ